MNKDEHRSRGEPISRRAAGARAGTLRFVRRHAWPLVALAAVVVVVWRGWWVPNNLVAAHRLAGTTSVRIEFVRYEGPAEPVFARTLSGGQEVGRLVGALNRPLIFHPEATPGCGDWFRLTFLCRDGTSYVLDYHHYPKVGTFVYTRGGVPGSAQAPGAFHRLMAAIAGPVLVEQGCCG